MPQSFCMWWWREIPFFYELTPSCSACNQLLYNQLLYWLSSSRSSCVVSSQIFSNNLYSTSHSMIWEYCCKFNELVHVKLAIFLALEFGLVICLSMELIIKYYATQVRLHSALGYVVNLTLWCHTSVWFVCKNIDMILGKISWGLTMLWERSQ